MDGVRAWIREHCLPRALGEVAEDCPSRERCVSRRGESREVHVGDDEEEEAAWRVVVVGSNDGEGRSEEKRSGSCGEGKRGTREG